MAADGVQHNHPVALQVIDVLFQPVKQHVIVAFTVNTLPWQVQLSHSLVRYPVTCPFAATVVIVPQHVNSRPLNNVEHAFLMLRQFLVVVRARHIGEHAGHRHRRRRSAGSGVGEIDHIIFFQQRVGLARIAG